MAGMQESGADQGTRTPNPRITSAVRYQLRQVGLVQKLDTVYNGVSMSSDANEVKSGYRRSVSEGNSPKRS